jgi:formylglycine-generating enzyme required for sulfatase activity
MKWFQICLIWGLMLTLALSGCGSDDDEASEIEAQEAVVQSDSQPAPTPTKIVLATATPKPAPPTPTPKPTNTPLPVVEQQADIEAEAALVIDRPMVLIPAGEFVLGSDDSSPENGPAHIVNLPAFEIDRFEVTKGDFSKFVEATGYQTEAEQSGSNRTWRYQLEGRENYPVDRISWFDAQAFCEWTGKRLPTEVEWEKAARGTDGRTYPWGNDLGSDLANVGAAGLRATVPVGSFPSGASPYGVEDMAGNVWEWTASWYQAYPGNAVENRFFGEKFRVIRGGDWYETPQFFASFNRNSTDPHAEANPDLGFRCARDVE